MGVECELLYLVALTATVTSCVGLVSNYRRRVLFYLLTYHVVCTWQKRKSL